MTKYFLDTCIWRDFYENRLSKSGNPLGKYATNLFMKIMKRKDKILFSKPLIQELSKDYNEKEIFAMLELLIANRTLIKVDITRKQYKYAGSLSEKANIPFIDCLFALQAKEHNAILVTQDRHFF